MIFSPRPSQCQPGRSSVGWTPGLGPNFVVLMPASPLSTVTLHDDTAQLPPASTMPSRTTVATTRQALAGPPPPSFSVVP
jgi:hypothetical protein